MARRRIKSPNDSDAIYTGTLRADGVVRKDVMDASKRSALMGRIRGKGTGPERMLHDLMLSRGWNPQLHVTTLPGTPDFVFPNDHVIVFVDGDFWHGWRFPSWEAKLTPKWRAKIAATRARDRRNHARLRRAGWRVVRIWEHQLKQDAPGCMARIVEAMDADMDRATWQSAQGSARLRK